ncbi:MAG: ABC transporter permease subunit [Armatimonadetes bacterium]|nr:ABC transporter permease subunit [Armatimonadota bacterium]
MRRSNPAGVHRGAMIVFLKEIREIFRDKRTVFGVVVSPLLLTPGLLALTGSFLNGEMRRARTEVLRVGMVQPIGADGVARALKATPNVRWTPVTAAEAERRVRERGLAAAIILPERADALLVGDRSVRVRVIYDSGSDKSNGAFMRLRLAVEAAGQAVARLRLQQKGLAPDFAAPFSVVDGALKTGAGPGARMVAVLLPYMLALACFSSGIHAANDSVAGEKERGTLETLLATPITRSELVAGKFAAVTCVCLTGALLSIAGLLVPFFSGLKAFEWLVKGGLSVTPLTILVVLAMQAPLAVLFSGLLLTLSTFARNQKEAQTYLGPLMMLILVPSMMSMFQGAEAPKTMALIPVLNASLIIKQALMQSYDIAFIGLALAASIAYAAVSMIGCARMFGRETVLLRT